MVAKLIARAKAVYEKGGLSQEFNYYSDKYARELACRGILSHDKEAKADNDEFRGSEFNYAKITIHKDYFVDDIKPGNNDFIKLADGETWRVANVKPLMASYLLECRNNERIGSFGR